MPIGRLVEFANRMFRLEAEEAMRAVTVAAIGSGNLAKDAVARVMRAWERAADGETTKPATDPDAALLGLAAMGFKVVRGEAR